MFPDINECNVETHDCDLNAECTNIVGGFTCTCNSGFTGNGSICTGKNRIIFFTYFNTIEMMDYYLLFDPFILFCYYI